MAFRRRSFAGRRRFSRSTPLRTKAWQPFAATLSEAATTQLNQTMFDPGIFTSAGSYEKRAARLERIRGQFNIQGNALDTVWFGITLDQLGEPTNNVSNNVFGSDEDVLYWGCIIVPTAITVVHFELDIKARRVCDIEAAIVWHSLSATATHTVNFATRALWSHG